MASKNFVQASNRREAIKKMISPDPVLRELYQEGPNQDGKAGWINVIRDQHGQGYRLLFYLDRIPLGEACGDREPYEVLYGEIDPDSDEVNFPRLLYTTTGAVNLVRDGIPGENFVKLLNKNNFEIETFERKRDILAKNMLDRGCLYICLYDQEADGMRILDMKDYSEIFFVPERNEIQVHSENEVAVGSTNQLRPFVLKIGTRRNQEEENSELEIAAREAERLWNEESGQR